jgi:rubrerythrin
MKFESGDLAICEVCGMQYDVPLTKAPKSCPICDVNDVTRSPRTQQN